jgi:hypothetical protein
MTKTVVLSKVEFNNVQISKHPGGGYACAVSYSIQNDDGSKSFASQSIKSTSESPESSKLSVGSDALIINFVNAITTLMVDREDF